MGVNKEADTIAFNAWYGTDENRMFDNAERLDEYPKLLLRCTEVFSKNKDFQVMAGERFFSDTPGRVSLVIFGNRYTVSYFQDQRFKKLAIEREDEKFTLGIYSEYNGRANNAFLEYKLDKNEPYAHLDTLFAFNQFLSLLSELEEILNTN